MDSKRLTKSSDNKKISGVLAGIGNYLDIDPTVVRVLYIIIALFTAFIPALIAYIILAIVIPNE